MLLSCDRNREFFDFSEFSQAGMSHSPNKKLLIYINLHDAQISKSTGLDFSCSMGLPHQLKPYIESENHDVLFLIDTPEDKLDWLNERLENWCFDRDYLITFSTPSFFMEARKQRVQWISILFDKNGLYIDHTNPSLSNFRKLMEQ